MNGCSFRGILLMALCVQAVDISPVLAGDAGFTRWTAHGMELGAGSFGLNFQHRLFQPGLEEEMCGRCRQYLEFGFEWDEFDGPDGVDIDSTAFTVGYRYYVLTGDGPKRREKGLKEGLAAYLAAGLGRYDLDRLSAEPGFYAKAALEYPLTQSGRKQSKVNSEEPVLRKVLWSVIGSVRYDEVDLGDSDLDDTSVRIGIRMSIPSKRDRQRAQCQRDREALIASVKTKVDLERVLRESRPESCFDPKDQQRLDELPSGD